MGNNNNSQIVKLKINIIANDRGHVRSLLDSAVMCGFSEDLFCVYWNEIDNKYDPYKLIAQRIADSIEEFELFVHQDVRFLPEYGYTKLSKLLNELPDDVAVVGLAGFSSTCNWTSNVTDPTSVLTTKVLEQHTDASQLDECFLGIRTNSKVSTTQTLSGFHCYGTDLVLSAKSMNLRAVVIPFGIRHLSAGNFDNSYHTARMNLEAYWCNHFFGFTGGYCVLARTKILQWILTRKICREVFIKLVGSSLLYIRRF